MAEMRTIYNEIMADLVSKGFGGLVQQLDPNYQNISVCKNEILNKNLYTAPKTKNEEPAVKPLSGGFSLLSEEVGY
jgi:hypothetical protein